MEEKIFAGFIFGRFQNYSGAWQHYCNAFMPEKFSDGANRTEDHFGKNTL